MIILILYINFLRIIQIIPKSSSKIDTHWSDNIKTEQQLQHLIVSSKRKVSVN